MRKSKQPLLSTIVALVVVLVLAGFAVRTAQKVAANRGSVVIRYDAYGRPIDVEGFDYRGEPTMIVLTESRIEYTNWERVVSFLKEYKEAAGQVLNGAF